MSGIDSLWEHVAQVATQKEAIIETLSAVTQWIPEEMQKEEEDGA